MKKTVFVMAALLLAGCKTFKQNRTTAETGIVPAEWTAEKSRTALTRAAGKWIEDAANKGQTFDKWYMIWYTPNQVWDLVNSLLKQGYAVRVTVGEDKQPQWVYVAWDDLDTFNRATQEELDK